MQKSIVLFPLFAILGAFSGALLPEFFSALKPSIIPLLMLVMFAMGLSLAVADFKQAWNYRKIALIGVALQFTLMPLLAVLLAKAFNLSDEWLIGMVLVGTAAGGTASNVMTYLAKGNLALSVSMTLFSTLLSVILMPWLTWLYLNSHIEVPVNAMLMTLLQVVLFPVLLGMLARRLFSSWVKASEPFLPQIAIWAIVIIIAIVVALNHANIAAISSVLLIAVMLHNLGGLFSGYLLSRLLGFDSVVSRTVAIEVAMQNSGLSVALAIKYFSATSALPGAIFSLWHNISGSLFAAYWQSHQKNQKGK